MPAKDRYHDAVKRALIKDGWTIEGEQFTLTVDKRNLWIDIQASKGEPQLIILIEVKELADVDSAIEALANALGKFELYRLALRVSNLDYPLYLAVTKQSYNGILSERIGKLAVGYAQIPLIVLMQRRRKLSNGYINQNGLRCSHGICPKRFEQPKLFYPITTTTRSFRWLL